MNRSPSQLDSAQRSLALPLLALGGSWLASLLFYGLNGFSFLDVELPLFLHLGQPFSVLVKWLAIALLAMWVLSRARPGERFLAVAVLVHSVGDVLIAVGPLIAAIAAFLLGHLCYAWLFWRLLSQSAAGVEALPAWRKGLRLALVIYGALFAAYLVPQVEGVLQPAVAVYAACLLGMALLAAGWRSGAHDRDGLLVIAGALLYVFSDSMIGLEQFAEPLPASQWLIWPTYFFGQWLIAWGVVGELPVFGRRG